MKTEINKIANARQMINRLSSMLDNMIKNLDKMVTDEKYIEELLTVLNELDIAMSDLAAYDNFKDVDASMIEEVRNVKSCVLNIQNNVGPKKEGYTLIKNNVLPELSRRIDMYEKLIMLKIVSETTSIIIREFDHPKFPRNAVLNSLKSSYDNEFANVRIDDDMGLSSLDALLVHLTDKYPATLKSYDSTLLPVYHGGVIDTINGGLRSLIGTYSSEEEGIQTGVNNISGAIKNTNAILDDLNDETKNPVNRNNMDMLNKNGIEALQYTSLKSSDALKESSKFIDQIKPFDNYVYSNIEKELSRIYDVLEKARFEHGTKEEIETVLEIIAAATDNLILSLEEPSTRMLSLQKFIHLQIDIIKKNIIIEGPKR